MHYYSTKNRDYAERKLSDKITVLRKIGKSLVSEQVCGVLDRFDGKVINKRLDDALKDAYAFAWLGRAERVGDRGVGRLSRKQEDYGGAQWIAYYWSESSGYESRDLRLYGDDYGKDYKPETGERLDAAAVKEMFSKLASAYSKEADGIQRSLDRVDEMFAEYNALCDAERAYYEKWDTAVTHAFGVEV